jgi:hypothetical protein
MHTVMPGNRWRLIVLCGLLLVVPVRGWAQSAGTIAGVVKMRRGRCSLASRWKRRVPR